MRIAVVCNDTRGGVQPYVALARRMHRAGMEVQAVAPEHLAYMFADCKIQVAHLSGPADEAVALTRKAAEAGTIASMKLMLAELPARICTWTSETLSACQDVDAIAGGLGGMVSGLSVAEKLGKPFIQMHLQPVFAPSTQYPGVLLPGVPHWLGKSAILASHYLSDAALWIPFERALELARSRVLGLRGKPSIVSSLPVLYGFSKHVVPINGTQKHPCIATGYWTLPACDNWRPPPGLENFLCRADDVVSIGFGSMPSKDAEALTALVCKAARRAGARAVLLGGWGGLSCGQVSDDVFFANEVPHEWLFKCVKAIVHHGGAGTTGAGLRAGKPSIVIPFTMDQPFWAARVSSLGAGPAPISRGRLTVERLSAALGAALNNQALRARARELGEILQAEDGTAEAVRLLEQVLSS